MKRMIAWLLLVTMLLGAFAGCGSTNTEQTPTEPSAAAAAGDIEGITAAIDYLKMFYKDSGSKTGADFERYGIVRIAGVPYEVVWTADVGEDLVKAVVNDDGMVTIDVSEECEEDTPYVLTATITDDAGNTTSSSWEYILPAGLGSDYCAIVDMAYALEKGAAMETPATLVGTVTAINTAWSEEYKNITVTITVEGREDKPIECYRLKGEGAKDLAVGDLITVTGILKNYNGKIEFDAGSELVKVAKGAGNLGDIPTDPLDIVDAAYALEVGASLPYSVTLTGTVSSIDTPYSPDYKNVTVSIQVEGREEKPIMCYRMKGEGADIVMPGDVITVSGIIKNYNNTIEFDTGCQLLSVTKGENSMQILTDPDEILKAAVELEPGEYLPYPVTLTGEIIGLGYGGYSEQYGNITVSITTGDGYYVKCYRMKGVDVDKIWLGDEITVSGNLMNYDGTIEFDAGCIMDSWVDKPNPKAPSDPAEIVKAAYKLSNFSSLPYYCTLTGKVTYVGSFSPTPGNRNVEMIVAGKKITAYKLSGAGVEGIKVDDTITVWGMLTNYWGTIEFDSGCKLVSKQSAVVEDLFDLKPGEAMEDEQVLTGKVTAVTIGSSSSDVKIKVKGKTILCSGLTGYGYDKLEKKDTVTVRGILENKDGSYQFQKGCELQSWSNYNRPKVNAHTSSSKEIAYAATQLGTADSLVNFFVWGNVSSVDTPYDKGYENVTVTIDVGGIKIKCFRMKGEGANKIGVGDKVGVSGDLINYQGTIEFTSGCQLVKYELVKKPDTSKVTPAQILEDAYALEPGESLAGTYTLTGTISKYSYAEGYNNADMVLTVDGCEDKPIKCFRLTGKGVSLLKNGDQITVTGSITNYNGTIEFTQGCTFTKSSWDLPSDFASQYEYAKENLGTKDTMPVSTSFKAKIVSIDEAYSSQYKNITVTVKCGNITIQCYRLKGGENLSVGDTITVSGSLQMWYEGLQVSSGATYKKEASAEPEVPETTEPTVPETSEPTVPETSEPTVPETSEPTVPETSEPTVPETSEPTVPETSESTVPETSEPTE